MKKTIFFVIIILILLALVWEIFISPIFNEVVVQDELVFDFPDEEIVEQPIIVIGSETEDSESKTEKTPDLETSSENNTTNRPALSPKKEIEPTTKTTKPAQSGTTLPTQTLTQLQVQSPSTQASSQTPKQVVQPKPKPKAQPQILLSKPSKVQSTFGHPAEGNLVRAQQGDRTILRYEDFDTIDGVRLNVYLLKDLDGKEFYDLGFRRGTTGSINYNIPPGIDVDDYKYIAYWCVPFGVLFNYAEIPSL